MAEAGRDAVITGIGILSCLGEGARAHWDRLVAAEPTADTTSFAPYVVHPLPAITFEQQIPKKSDLRTMEPWQRIGTYAAGLALDDAQVKGHPDLLARTDMIVAAGGGERDLAADSAILSDIRAAANPAAFLNERLMNDLRPTLFLAQLSNLLAGNISIVHGVTGSSRTFMGEENAGVDAVKVAVARIQSGQSEIALVGGAYNAERQDAMLYYEFAGHLLRHRLSPVWSRENGGFAPGSSGAFLVLESRAHALARGATPVARIRTVLSDRSDRRPGALAASLDRMFAQVGPGLRPQEAAILSGASGAQPATTDERAFLARHAEFAVRAPGSYTGHALEGQFPLNIALAATALRQRELFPPCPGTDVERTMSGPLTQVIVTSVGHWRGEGLALIETP